ncbi:MAG: hypothetical protein HXO42_00190 [Prevotella sp.]|uniref:hypothetical protein n=1 Tax=Prevotella sp. TaxID=59823 RepID=UPI001CACEB8F|nr:hypothetical protein [Prevotella sp.]MBF1618905.1 hypothetical protein [Prevotella sp.]
MKGITLKDYEAVIQPHRGPDGKIISGLVIGDTLHQNQALILNLHKGELKERPMAGCGISDMLLDNDPIYWRTLIREQLEMDRQTVTNIKITTKSIEIDAQY